MDLYSDFNQERWVNKGEPPEKIKGLDGYEMCNMLRNAADEKDGERIFHYYMTTDAGIPVQAFLYGAARDPLRSIGHCGMKIVDKNHVKLITGCIVEEDWVEMTQEYFDSLDVHGEEEKKEVSKRLSLIIGLAGDLQEDKWDKKDKPPKNKSKLGYHYINIVRCQNHGDGNFEYFVNDDDGHPMTAFLSGADRDPLRSVGNCYLRMVKTDGKEMITGMIVDDDWVEIR